MFDQSSCCLVCHPRWTSKKNIKHEGSLPITWAHHKIVCPTNLTQQVHFTAHLTLIDVIVGIELDLGHDHSKQSPTHRCWKEQVNYPWLQQYTAQNALFAFLHLRVCLTSSAITVLFKKVDVAMWSPLFQLQGHLAATILANPPNPWIGNETPKYSLRNFLPCSSIRSPWLKSREAIEQFLIVDTFSFLLQTDVVLGPQRKQEHRENAHCGKDKKWWFRSFLPNMDHKHHHKSKGKNLDGCQRVGAKC